MEAAQVRKGIITSALALVRSTDWMFVDDGECSAYCCGCGSSAGGHHRESCPALLLDGRVRLYLYLSNGEPIELDEQWVLVHRDRSFGSGGEQPSNTPADSSLVVSFTHKGPLFNIDHYFLVHNEDELKRLIADNKKAIETKYWVLPNSKLQHLM